MASNSSGGKVAIVTGGGTGIGKAAALALLARRLARRASPGRRQEPLDEVVAEAGRRRPRAGRAHRRDRPGLGRGLVRRDGQGLGPGRPAVQQRRRGRCRGAAGGLAAGAMEARGGHQPERHVLRHPAGLSRDEGADADGRAHHQQRLDLGARAAPAFDRLHRDQARGDGPDQDARRWTAASTTSPWARSTSAMP